jgi:hypothetical protein
MTLIVRESPRMRFHSDLREVVAALDGVHRDYLWFLSAVDAHRLGDGPFPVEFEHNGEGDTNDQWVTGDRLEEIANSYSLQVVWGVFSAFPRDAPFAGGVVEPRPTAQPWDRRTRHPDAQIEIVAFDSTFTAITARDTEVEAAFGRYFSQGERSETI